MINKKYFGTDGIRGRVGQDPISPDWVLKLGWAVGKVLASEGSKKILIGKDTRISGYIFESALEAGLAAAGINVNLLGPMPTPAVAYLTRTLRASAGIVISASHNSFEDNGIKFFSRDGYKLSDEIELEIEHKINDKLTTVASANLGRVSRITDAAGRYIEFCKSAFTSGTLNGLKIVIDCANGATYHIAPHVFTELGATVITIAIKPDGLNINDNCGSTSPSNVAKAVLENKADLGIAFDGDGDRLIMVDSNGDILDGDALIYILANAYKERNSNFSGVVGTVMSNIGLEQALLQLGLSFHRANVGDRYVLEQLIKQNLVLGGESSGHLICLDVNTTGDGIVSALRVLSHCVNQQKPLFEMVKGYIKFPQVIKNIPIIDRTITNHPELLREIAAIESKLGKLGRVLLRASGTEPVIRLMIEGEEKSVITKHAEHLANIVAILVEKQQLAVS